MICLLITVEVTDFLNRVIAISKKRLLSPGSSRVTIITRPPAGGMMAARGRKIGITRLEPSNSMG
ncbi:MAG: hypothetical protein EOP51_25305 [Sphingobacteriales bacterium]|nr:MAG: hypothetical protein EOP51_25305 [Sphingobacteriales bacterium]